jgi:hypothetical protein
MIATHQDMRAATDTTITEAAGRLINDAEWRAARAKVDEISGRLDRVGREINATGTLPTAAADTRIRAEALLEGRDSVSADVLRAEALGRYGLLCDRRRVLTEALRIAQQHSEQIRQRLSARICAAVMPHYRGLVSRLASALATAGEINDALAEITETLEGHEIAVTAYLRPMQCRAVGRASDAYSAANVWLKEAVEYQFIQEESR